MGDHLVLDQTPLLDAPMTLAATAAATSRIELGTSVFLPSLRPPAWAAKQVATLCHLAAPRRVHLGVGLGAGPEEEYRTAGTTRSGRAKRTDDFLRALPDLLAGRSTPLVTGPLGAEQDVQLRPAVLPPVTWVGGSSPSALRRAASSASGWLAAFCTASGLASSRAQLEAFAEQRGRPRPRVGLVTHAVLRAGGDSRARQTAADVLVSSYGLSPEVARDLAVGGAPAHVAEQLAPYVAAGVTQVVVISDVGSWGETCESLAEVRRLLNG